MQTVMVLDLVPLFLYVTHWILQVGYPIVMIWMIIVIPMYMIVLAYAMEVLRLMVLEDRCRYFLQCIL